MTAKFNLNTKAGRELIAELKEIAARKDYRLLDTYKRLVIANMGVDAWLKIARKLVA